MADDLILSVIEFMRQRYATYGEFQIHSDFLSTSRDWRNAFDAYLVRHQHPLAFQPGTQEHRVVSFVKAVNS